MNEVDGLVRVLESIDRIVEEVGLDIMEAEVARLSADPDPDE